MAEVVDYGPRPNRNLVETDFGLIFSPVKKSSPSEIQRVAVTQMILTLHSRAWVRTCNRLRGLETFSGLLLPKQIKGSAESDGFFTTPEAD